ncbi:6-phosphofructokinase [Candidatus Symbiobacter mobilis]|uniref:ATP-dependent 6-phosphofructokinase n=1 Tax=Candidatus Symbiobacter mobilis CR TaxID=946483 RepID=U5N661_9BURK|nr:ATP-dependent 6-phosphofructokinase [Candidatus Symbiobacter mobilis]AGX87001.1 6-phosphofructokinase [Candidatus Symbiobacter mobilis CR]
MKKIKRIAVCTGGGDAPGLNAVIQAVAVSAANRGWDCFGIREGFNGILFPERYDGNGVIRLTRDRVRGIGHLGGTILGTTNTGNPMSFPMTTPDGKTSEIDRTGEIAAYFASHEIDALISIGGDGSLTIAEHLCEKYGMCVIGVPKTIDNDLDKTFTTFGFDSAVSFATECLDRLHSTAQSHNRVMVVEVMGRYAGWIALHAGIAGGAHAILLPEIPYDINKVANKVRQRSAEGRDYSIVLVAEAAHACGSGMEIKAPAEVGHQERLGGVGEHVARELGILTHKEVRSVVLGHLVRGGGPTAFDRLTALRFGSAAVRALDLGMNRIMVALGMLGVDYIPLSEVAGRMRTVPLDCDTLQTGRDLGISFGD